MQRKKQEVLSTLFGDSDSNSTYESVPDDHALVLSPSNSFLGGSYGEEEE